MEIYADERTERVYVRHDRGPYVVLDRDGSIGESHIPRGAQLVYATDELVGDEAVAYDAGFAAGKEAGRLTAAPAAAGGQS